MRRIVFFILFIFADLSVIQLAVVSPASTSYPFQANDDWEKQLKEMNYLIIQISSVNIINGLYFTKEQATALQNYSKEFSSVITSELDTTGNASADLSEVRRVYFKLLRVLQVKEVVSDSLKNQVYAARILEADIIKRSLLGAQKRGNIDAGCRKCHASPEYFPLGDISDKETKAIGEAERIEVDKAHSSGLFGQEGVVKLWFMKEKADTILTDGQKYIMKNFRCCLVPPDGLKDPTNIGQAFISDEWINYFRSIRKLSEKEWEKYQDLFILPLDTLIRATLPGIQVKKVKEMMNEAENVIKDARSLDDIDFELQRQKLCLKMKEALKASSLMDKSSQESDIRKFITAMFLLFPESDKLYSSISGYQK